MNLLAYSLRLSVREQLDCIRLTNLTSIFITLIPRIVEETLDNGRISIVCLIKCVHLSSVKIT